MCAFVGNAPAEADAGLDPCDDTLIALRRAVEDLGGTLQVVAVFGMSRSGSEVSRRGRSSAPPSLRPGFHDASAFASHHAPRRNALN